MKVTDLIADASSKEERTQIWECSENCERIKDIINPSELVQLAAVSNKRIALTYIKEPTIKVQVYAVTRNWVVINLMQDPCKEALNTALTNENAILNQYSSYISIVKQLFKGNSIMINKWIRYADNIRSLT